MLFSKYVFRLTKDRNILDMNSAYNKIISALIWFCNLISSKSTTLALGFLSALFAFIGFNYNGDNFLASWYQTMGLVLGDYSFSSDTEMNIFLKISLVIAPLFATSALLCIFAKKLGLWLFLNFKQNYTIICGLGNIGSVLASDILKKKMDVLAVEIDDKNKNIQNFLDDGGQILVGNALDKNTLKKSGAKKAKEIILVCGNDSINLEILSKIINLIDKSTSVYIHLQNRENYEFLSINDKLKDYKIKNFNIYDNAAISLILNHQIAPNLDMTKDDCVARIAIVGFDELALALLYRLLALGHFYNGNPIQIVVFDDEPQKSQREFLKIYPIKLKDDKLNLWDVEFKDEIDLYSGRDLDFCEIIFSSKKRQDGFLDFAKFIKNNIKTLEKTEIFVFSDKYTNTDDLLQGKESFKTFGDFLEICSYDVIVNQSLDDMAKQTNNSYNELHGYGDKYPWDNLGIFLQDSNRMQALHLSIKIPTINRLKEKFIQTQDYESIKKETKKRWLKFGESELLWDQIEGARQIVSLLGVENLEKLAKAEKNRWNAFYILNGWTKLNYKEGEGFKKSESAKEHPCIVAWEELDFVSEKHGRDYKIDDIETIVRAYLIVKDELRFEYIQEFKKHIEEYK